MELDFLIAAEEEDIYKCRKHPYPSHKITGICPSCLRDRLLLLCPDCANLRPCACYHPSSSSSSSSLSSRSSSDPARASVSGTVGSIGRVSNLMESEPAFQRSRSVATFFVRQRSEREEKGKKVKGFWGFLKSKEREEIEEFSRSRSVGGDERLRLKERRRLIRGGGWNWNFMSPMRVFKQKKVAVVQNFI